jgi:hypothetical protein
MSRLSTVAFVALSTLVASLAYAERPYESSRPDLNSYDRPTSVTRESFKPSDLRPNPRAELVLPAKDGNVDTKYGSAALRPDAKRDAFVPVDESGHVRGLRANMDVQKGKPNLSHNAKREAFMPADEEGRTRGVRANQEVRAGKPNLRPEAKRDAFVPVDENSGNKRGLNPNKDVKPALGDKAQEMGRQMVCSFTALCE